MHTAGVKKVVQDKNNLRRIGLISVIILFCDHLHKFVIFHQIFSGNKNLISLDKTWCEVLKHYEDRQYVVEDYQWPVDRRYQDHRWPEDNYQQDIQ